MVQKNKTFEVFAHVILIALSICVIFSFILLISSSITEEATLIRSGYSFIPQKVNFAAYKFLLVDSTSIIRGYFISFSVTVIGTIANLTLTTLFAYPLFKKDLPGRKFFAFFLFFTMLFNGGLVSSYIMWTQTFHIKNTLLNICVCFQTGGIFSRSNRCFQAAANFMNTVWRIIPIRLIRIIWMRLWWGAFTPSVQSQRNWVSN